VLLASLLFPAAAANGKGPAAAAGVDHGDIHYDPVFYGPDLPLRQIIEQDSLELVDSLFVPEARIEVRKSQYQLLLWSGDHLLKIYRIQLGGRHPSGDKSRQGDGRTPEGTYRVCRHNPASRYYKSLVLNYPNLDDVQRGLDSGLITAAQAAGLRQKLEAGECPPFHTPLGGDILIHGQHPKVTRNLRQEHAGRRLRAGLQPGDLDPFTLREFYNWTLGCIAVTNPDMRELYEHVPDGARVDIYP